MRHGQGYVPTGDRCGITGYQFVEQAIFIVRNDALSKDGVTAQQLVDEACRVARSYTRSHSTRRPLLRCGSPVFWSAAGALGIALVWLLTALV